MLSSMTVDMRNLVSLRDGRGLRKCEWLAWCLMRKDSALGFFRGMVLRDELSAVFI